MSTDTGGLTATSAPSALVNGKTCQLSGPLTRSLLAFEGLTANGRLHPVQRALVEERASQCGYCTPGTALRAAASPLAQGPYRALAATANTFARESCVDELAYAASPLLADCRVPRFSDVPAIEQCSSTGRTSRPPGRARHR